jgi:hypothetical protein
VPQPPWRKRAKNKQAAADVEDVAKCTLKTTVPAQDSFRRVWTGSTRHKCRKELQLDAATVDQVDIPRTAMGTVPRTVPGVIQDATSKAARGPIRAATCPLNYRTEPTVIPTFICRASRELTDELAR